MHNESVGIILLAFGGADSPEAIEPFMKNLMGGRIPPPALVEKIKARYGLIGGKSPLPEITAKQAEKLERYLQLQGKNCKVTVGMRYWHPYISEALQQLLADGVSNIVALSLAPFYSEVSSGAYLAELNKEIAAMPGQKPEIVIAEPMYNNSLFIDAVAEKVEAGIAKFPAERRSNVRVIFSAHSLPVNYIKNGDPYVQQLEITVDRIVEKLNLANWFIAYQSKGGGHGEWLAPTVESTMDQIKNDGFSDVLVVPIGFVSDHIETLYDIDIAQKDHAVSLGLNFNRTESLNTSDLFIKALASMTEKTE